jgi:L-2,4-diaminobutyric acid acetyltransferase
MTAAIQFRTPVATDGSRVHDLIHRCPPLDVNSLYCNVLQCSHFADTSVVAESDGGVVGFVSGYLLPSTRDTIFVWQVAVAPERRSQGLALAMLSALLERDVCRTVTSLETSITRDNHPSWRSFRALARTLGADLVTEPWLSRVTHFSSRHESEYLVRIGPIAHQNQNRTLKESHR